jgi:nicotinamidase-related amidase
VNILNSENVNPSDTELTRSGLLLSRDRSLLLVVDVQERLLPTIADHQSLLCAVQLLVRAARRLQVPVVVSEQYPKGLGSTVAALQADLTDIPRFEKLQFSAAGGIHEFLNGDISQIILCGIETHVCILQTALDLISHGLQVFVVSDAAGSYSPDDRLVAIQRMRDSGCIMMSSESVVFEWCETAAAGEFKDLSRLVRERRDALQNVVR